MDEDGSIITIDWRKFGDYSAVGQLTEKIFSADSKSAIYPVQCLDDGKSCNVFKRGRGGGVSNLFQEPVGHDAAINRIRKLNPKVIYVRLSPHKFVLEFACKLCALLKEVPLVVHYMDMLHLNDMRPFEARYIKSLYDYLYKKADRIYTVHQSIADTLELQSSRKVRFLGNFIAQDTVAAKPFSLSESGNLNLAYFGSIDRRMNYDALLEICELVVRQPWISLTIWSNSGVWGGLKKVVEKAPNINARESNLSVSEYRESLRASDMLLLAYNMDESSIDYLMHSFSNKLIDYVEAERQILCYGSRRIPTVSECDKYGLAIICENSDELKNILSSPQELQERAPDIASESYANGVKEMARSQHQAVNDFIAYLRAHMQSDVVVTQKAAAQNLLHSEAQESMNARVSFLARRKFFDKTHDVQSLAATLMAKIISEKTASGIFYEV